MGNNFKDWLTENFASICFILMLIGFLWMVCTGRQHVDF